MSIEVCACGSREFIGTMQVIFEGVPVLLDEDGYPEGDWEEGQASEDRVLWVSCAQCGAEQINRDDDEDLA